jgi:hypothetical protein
MFESCGRGEERPEVGHGMEVNGFEEGVNIHQITGFGVACMSLRRLKHS